jgi:hypothetical protein
MDTTKLKDLLKEFLESNESFKDFSFFITIIDDKTNEVEHLYNACPCCVKEEIDEFILNEGIEHVKDRGIH